MRKKVTATMTVTKSSKKAFHPEVDDPEAPVVHHGVVGGAAEEEGRQIKERNGQGRQP